MQNLRFYELWASAGIPRTSRFWKRGCSRTARSRKGDFLERPVLEHGPALAARGRLSAQTPGSAWPGDLQFPGRAGRIVFHGLRLQLGALLASRGSVSQPFALSRSISVVGVWGIFGDWGIVGF